MEKWDEAKFRKNKGLILGEIVREMGEINSIRGKSLLLTNLVEWYTKNIMEYELECKSARTISRATILKILEEKGIIDTELKEDINHIFQIRDLLSHNLSLIEIKEEAEVHIKNMNLTPELKKKNKDWDGLDTHNKIEQIFLILIDYLDLLYDNLVMEKAKSKSLDDNFK